MENTKDELAQFGIRLEVRSLAELHNYDSNPRAHPEENIAAIAGSIEKFGFKDVVIADKDGEVIAGHGRILAAQRQGLTKLPVLIVDLDKTQAKAYRLAHNRASELAAWDLSKLLVEVKELQDIQFDMESVGFGAQDLVDLIPGEIKVTDSVMPDHNPETEAVIEIHCNKPDVAEFMPTLELWAKRDGCTVNVS